MGKHFLLLIFLTFTFSCTSQPADEVQLQVGAARFEEYLPMLENKKIGLFVNHTSLVGNTHISDTLMVLGINVAKIFSPEHGFRGKLSDGEEVTDQKNDKTYELISLYGASKRPADEQINDLDMLIIDIQDVGVRFYTYASTMTYLMEACAKNNVPVIVLDRPNPNGSYIDGPVLNEAFESFIGLHPIPIVHGLTLGELAIMINGEGWLKDHVKCDLKVVPIANWDHSMVYSLPVRPSPNLPNDHSVALYPSLALFESTIVSIGRGTDMQFQVVGHPQYPDTAFSFTPIPNEGSRYPPLEDEQCFGIALISDSIRYEFTLKHLIHFYKALKGRIDKPFFSPYFARHAGNDVLQKQIESGMTEKQIKATWEPELDAYRKLREQYLLYEDSANEFNHK